MKALVLEGEKVNARGELEEIPRKLWKYGYPMALTRMATIAAGISRFFRRTRGF